MSIEDFARTVDKMYPLAGGSVDGRHVRSSIPNTSSIAGYMREQATLRGVRVVPMSELPMPRQLGYSVSDFRRFEHLAKMIEESREINPLIVGVTEADGPFIIEGAHRCAALQMLKAKAAPALIVVGVD
jgi:hypothetical protein